MLDCTTFPVPLDSFALLQQAAIAYRLNHSQRPSATEVVAALLSLEKAAKAQRIRYPFSVLAGQWRLCYTTGVRKRKQGGITLGCLENLGLHDDQSAAFLPELIHRSSILWEVSV